MSNTQKKKSPILCILLILLAVCLVAALVVAFTLRAEIAGKDGGEPVTVSIAQGSGSATVAQALKDAGVIRYPFVFRQYLKKADAGGSLQYGDFALTKGMGYEEIIAILSQYVAAEQVRLSFPEGSTAQAIAQQMEDAGLCTAAEFLEVANTGDFSQYSFWEKIQTDPNCFMKCEGYLFPNTYDFLVDGTVYDYVDTFYKQFEMQMSPALYARMDELGLSLEQTVILASFVQEEAGNAESANVSAVFHNRLAPDSPFPMLESNASSYVQNPEDNNYLYNWVAPYYGGWENIPENIYNAYNTYAVVGLPAGPISNPGAEAIQAALYPTEDWPYYFFVTDLTGHYYYGKTVSEHGANCEKAWAVNAKLGK